jgi:hypothetical protein
VYSETVTANKSVLLLGAQHGVDARTGRVGATESVLDATSNGGQTLFNATASDVTIDGFKVQNQTSTVVFGFGILLGAGTSGSHVLNNIIQNNIAGLSLANASSSDQTVIQFNLFQNNNNPGSVSGTAIYTDQSNAGGALTNVLIDSNAFTRHRRRVCGRQPEHHGHQQPHPGQRHRWPQPEQRCLLGNARRHQ